MKVIGLIADIVASHDILGRRDFQGNLAKTLRRVSTAAGAAIISPYTITLGDEFQALYKEPRGLFRDLVSILWETHPTRIRFALSHDELLTEINPNAAIGMDGPAFGAARKLLISMKSTHRTIIQIESRGSRTAELVNASLRVFSNEIDSWNRTAVGALYCLLDGRPVGEMIGLLRVKKRSIYKAISAHHIRDHVSLLQAIEVQLAAEAAAADVN
jgi:hypothetical protein